MEKASYVLILIFHKEKMLGLGKSNHECIDNKKKKDPAQ